MENINFLPENEYTEVDGRKYLTPSLPVTQTNQFIDNFRNNQRANTQMINTQTRNLGTQIPSNLGGLTGGTGYFTSRYQTPQTNAATQNLRTAAQAQALNTALANEKAYWDKKYQDAYRAYQKRAYDKANTPSTTDTTTRGGVNYKNNANPVKAGISLTVNDNATAVAEPDGQGGTTGWVNYFYPDGTTKRVYEGVELTHDVGRAAGADQLSDIFTGMYNYTLPGGIELELGGWDENLMQDQDGNYYIWTKSSNSYTPVIGSSGKTGGGSRWWSK